MALKADVTGPKNVLFAGVSLHLLARQNLQAVSVKGLKYFFSQKLIAMFSVPCCCFHPSQVSAARFKSCVN